MAYLNDMEVVILDTCFLQEKWFAVVRGDRYLEMYTTVPFCHEHLWFDAILLSIYTNRPLHP